MGAGALPPDTCTHTPLLTPLPLALPPPRPSPQTKEGEVFESDTDTEVIPKLCKFLYSRLPEPIPFPQLVRAAIAPRGCVEGQGRSSKGVGRRACRSLDRASYNAAAPIAMRTPLMPRCTPHFAALPPLREHSFHPPGVRGGQAAGGRVRPAHQVRRLPWRAGGLPPPPRAPPTRPTPRSRPSSPAPPATAPSSSTRWPPTAPPSSTASSSSWPRRPRPWWSTPSSECAHACVACVEGSRARRWGARGAARHGPLTPPSPPAPF